MQGYNLVAVFSKDCSKMLMCKRLKDPYEGLINMVGGKIEENEDHETAAYRELFEETGITREQIKLTHLMDFTYHLDNCYVEVYVGRLNCEVTVKGDENTLFWSGFDHDFFDMEEYAGEGNIGHIMEHIKLFKEQLL
ncbi:MAG: NUDIX domain-containing protein [Ruminiclostridium sp.]|nr:NUDIX domain-containing protein [Ruminiclostridium sp.]